MIDWIIPYKLKIFFIALYYYIPTKIKNSRLYIKLFYKKDFISVIYVDQEPSKSLFGDMSISSFYTPFGIKTIDFEFGERIRNIKESGEDSKKLRNEIKNNKNLHKMIKDNLLLNLKNYTK